MSLKNTIYKIAYHPSINVLLRGISKFIYKISGNKIINVAGTVDLKLRSKDIDFQLKTDQTCSAAQELYYNGPDNYEFTSLFTELLSNSNNFFDIGANIGYFSVIAGKIKPSLKIYAFEPSIGAAQYLRDNIALNKLTNVRVIQKAVSNSDGQLTFHNVVSDKYPWIKYSLNGSHSLQNQFGRKKDQSYLVDVISLKKFKTEEGIDRIDLIKLDTECTEHIILGDIVEIVNFDRPLIFTEIYQEIYEDFEKIFNVFDSYLMFQVVGDEVISLQGLSDGKVDSKDSNFLLVPLEKLRTIERFYKK